MYTSPGRSVRALPLICSALLVGPAFGTDQVWSDVIVSPDVRTIAQPTAVPLSDGTVLLRSSSYGGYDLRFDAEGQRVGTPQVLLSGQHINQSTPEGADSRRWLNIDFVPYDWSIDATAIKSACRHSNDFLGVTARQFHPHLRIDLELPSSGTTERIASYESEPEQHWISWFDADCQRRDLLSVTSAFSVPVYQAAPSRGFALVSLGQSSEPRPYRLLALSREGVDWLLDFSSLDLSFSPGRVEPTPDGGIAMIGGDSRTLSRLGANGVLIWQRTVEGFRDGVNVFADGDRLVLTGSGVENDSYIVQAFATDGAPLGSRVLQGAIQAFLLPSAGAPLVWREQISGGPAPPQPVLPPAAHAAVMLDAHGEWITILSGDRGLAPLARLASGKLLVQRAGMPSSLALYDPATDDLVDLDPLTVPDRQRVGGILLHEDGVYYMHEDPDGALIATHRSRDGALRWRTSLPDLNGSPPRALASGREYLLVGNADRLCVRHTGHEGGVACLSGADGSLLFGWLHTAGFARGDDLRLLPDNTLRSTSLVCPVATGLCSPQSVEIRRFTADGTAMPVITASPPTDGDAYNYFTAGSDRFLIARAGSDSTLKMIGADGSTLWQRSAPGARLQGLGVSALNEALLLDGTVRASPSIELRDSQGMVKWRKTLLDGLPFDARVQAQPLPDGDWLVIEQPEASDADLQSTRTFLSRRSGETGDAIWSGWYRISGFETTVKLAESAGLALFAEVSASPARLLAVDLASGEARSALQIGERLPGSNGFRDASSAFGHLVIAARADGSVVSSILQPGTGEITVRSHPVDEWLTPAVPPELHQARGIWHADDTAGQGLFIDFEASTSNVFGGWFTFSVDGGHLASEQRWFTLLGTGTGTDTMGEISLEIYRTSDGRFVEGIVQDSEAVGSAVLRVLSCERAVLTYQLTAERTLEARGAIPLRRSTGAACTDDGVAGTGAWYRPDQSGQGLFFLPVAETDAGHQFAAAWFTFDPADASDDPESHGWFTLLGEIGDDGQGTLTIYRTIGAAFDRGYTDNSREVGTAEVTLTSCDAMRFAFTFVDDVGAFSAREGVIDLTRIGGCPPD